jgi:hypothetical protein
MIFTAVVVLNLAGLAFSELVAQGARDHEQEVLNIPEPKKYAIPVQVRRSWRVGGWTWLTHRSSRLKVSFTR